MWHLVTGSMDKQSACPKTLHSGMWHLVTGSMDKESACPKTLHSSCTTHSVISCKTWISGIIEPCCNQCPELTEGARDIHKAMAVQYGDTCTGKECCEQQDSNGHHNNQAGVPVQQVLVLVVWGDLHDCCSKQSPREEHLHSSCHPALKHASRICVLACEQLVFRKASNVLEITDKTWYHHLQKLILCIFERIYKRNHCYKVQKLKPYTLVVKK